MKTSIRPIKAEDLSFILDSWLKDWRTSKFAGTIPNHLYFPTQRATIEGLIGRGAVFRVLCAEGATDTILGWACGEVKDGQTILHFVYLRDSLIKHTELFTELVGALPGNKPGIITHNQQLKVFKEWRWIPEIVRRKDLERPQRSQRTDESPSLS